MTKLIMEVGWLEKSAWEALGEAVKHFDSADPLQKMNRITCSYTQRSSALGMCIPLNKDICFLLVRCLKKYCSPFFISQPSLKIKVLTVWITYSCLECTLAWYNTHKMLHGFGNTGFLPFHANADCLESNLGERGGKNKD